MQAKWNGAVATSIDIEGEMSDEESDLHMTVMEANKTRQMSPIRQINLQHRVAAWAELIMLLEEDMIALIQEPWTASC